MRIVNSHQRNAGNEMEKNVAINKAIAANIASGMDVKDAINQVFGIGAYEKIAGVLYDELRAKSAA